MPPKYRHVTIWKTPKLNTNFALINISAVSEDPIKTSNVGL